jgi:ribosomal protein S18 acetylase RimI-like enzyme
VIALRLATPADLRALLPRTRALNDHEGIAIGDDALAAALAQLLADATLGAAWSIEDSGTAIGYAITTYCFDLEFGGREAWLTELWIEPSARGRGAATAAIALLERELATRDVRALHLQVRPDNPAARLYARLGFEASPRLIMTHRLAK